MSIQFQQFPFVFSGGLNSKSDQFQLQSPQLLQADNVRFQLDGSISKRPGFVNLPNNIIGGGVISNGVACQSFNNELLAFDGTFVYSYSQTLNGWINKGLSISVINKQRKIINNRINQQNNPDGNILNGIELYVWEDSSGGIRYSMIDSSTKAFIVSDSILHNLGFRPKVISNNNLFNIFYLSSYNTLNLTTINPLYPNSDGYTTVLFSNGNPSSYTCYDVTILNGQPIIAYGGDQNVNIYVAGSSQIIAGSLPSSITAISISIDYTDEVIWVSYACNSGIFVIGMNYNLYQLLPPANISSPLIEQGIVNIATIPDIQNIKSLNITYEVSNYPDNFIVNGIVDIKGNVSNLKLQRSVGLASKPFIHNNQVFINTVYQSINQSTYFTLCASQGMKCINKINPGVSGGYRTNTLLAEVPNFPDDPDTFLFTNQLKGAFTSSTNNTSYSLLGVNATYIDFTNNNAFNSAIGSNNLHIVGGVEKIYDGVSFVEDNFHLFAELTDLSNGNSQPFLYQITTGGNLSVGQYQYQICYEWTDANNQVHRGQPSLPITITITTSNSAVVMQIPTLRITDKISPRSNVSIAVFRTILQSGIESDTFYKLTNDNSPLVNDVNVDFVVFTDNLSDLEVASKEPLYTSEQLYNQAPPSNSLISSYQTRIFLSGMEDPNIIWTSQDRFDLSNYNTIPIEFSPLLTEGVDPSGGAITAIHSLDQSMIVYKENSIFWFGGDGPNANATSGSFSNALPVPSNNGCINQNSIISIPTNAFNSGGLMYQSGKGIYLLDRSQSVSYIGAPIEQYNNYHISSVEMIEDQQEVVFITLEGICLVYNYYYNRWTTWSHLPAVDSCIYNGNLVLIRSDGTVLMQQDGNYSDNGKPIVRTVQIPWLAFAGITGFQSVMNVVMLGHYLSPHLINMSVMYNYDPTIKETITINSNAIVSNTFGGFNSFGSGLTFGGGPFVPYEFLYNFGYPWCQSLSLLITDNPLDNSNEGSIWTALSFKVGVLSQTNTTLPAQKKFSGIKVPNGRFQ